MRRIKCKIGFVLIVSVVCDTAAPNLLFAQETPAEKPALQSDDDAAREHYLRGERYYSEGDYELSIQEFRAAYELSDRPKLLFNLANAYERLSRFEQAIEALRKYSATLPEYEREAVSRRIRNLEKRADEKAKRDEALKALTKKSQQNLASNSTNSSVIPSGETPVAKPNEGGNTLAWVFLGSGVGVLGLGGAMAYWAQEAQDSAEARCVNGVCVEGAQGYVDDNKQYSLFADVAFGVGAAAVVTGTILLLTSKDDEKMSGLSANPTNTGFSVSYSGLF